MNGPRVSGRSALRPHPAPHTVFACHHVFLVSFPWTSSLAFFCLSGRWYFWQPVVTDNAPQFTLVWCFLIAVTGCVFVRGTREVMSELVSASNQKLPASSPPPTLLRSNWHITLHKFKVTICWFGGFVYCRMNSILHYWHLHPVIVITLFLWGEQVRSTCLGNFQVYNNTVLLISSLCCPPSP